jgi:hypothetical protein
MAGTVSLEVGVTVERGGTQAIRHWMLSGQAWTAARCRPVSPDPEI